MVRKNNVVRFRRFVGVACLVICASVVVLMVLVGCGNTPRSDDEVFVVHNPDRLVADTANIGGVTIDEDGNVSIPGNLTVVGNGDFDGTVTAEDVVAIDDVTAGDDLQYVDEVVQVPPLPPPDDDESPPPPSPPDDEEPALLMATLQSHNGADHFKVGDDVKLDFTVSGGVPPYDNRCQFVDGTFATNENSMATMFSFKERKEVLMMKGFGSYANLKIINSPGAGVVTCRATSADGQEVTASFTIYVE